jgi:hypothetical protein
VTYTSLDLNTDRVWALSGLPGKAPVADRLHGDAADLPLVLSLEERKVQVGQPGLALLRKSPHLACAGFLPQLGRKAEWSHGRHRLDAQKAVWHVFRRLRELLPDRKALAVAAPPYLSSEQVNLLVQSAREASVPVAAALPRSLAAALASYADQPWHDVGIVLDVDDHALTIGVFRPNDVELCLLGQKSLPAFGLRVWRERLMGMIADRCVRTSRRDPRECPDADQMVYEQLDGIFDATSQNRAASVQIQASQWYQTVALPHLEVITQTAPLARLAAAELKAALTWAEQHMTTASIWFTAAVARLPGMIAATYIATENRVPVSVLPANSAARAALELVHRIDEGDFEPGYYSSAAPLPLSDKHAGPQTIPFPQRRPAQSRG